MQDDAGVGWGAAEPRSFSKQSDYETRTPSKGVELTVEEERAMDRQEQRAKRATGTGIENAKQDQRRSEMAMENRELKEEQMRHDDQIHIIQEQLKEGIITEEEAQKRMTRGRMHSKIEEESSALRLDESAAAGAEYKTTVQIIDEVLDTEDRTYCLGWIKKVTGFHFLMQTAKFQRERRAKPTYKHKFPRIEKLVHGKAMRIQPGMSKQIDQVNQFELVLGSVLVFNGILIGIQASTPSDEEPPLAFFILEHFFTVVFSVELVLRLMSDGFLPWMCQLMNFCDFVLIVATGIVPMWVLGPLGIKSSAMRALQVLRVLRLIKLVRMVRTVPMFRIFWTLIRGILDNGRTLFWTYVMIFAVLYVFAIFGVYLIGKNEDYKYDPELWAFVQEHFGDVAKTLITLFQVMTLDSWTSIARPLMAESDVVAPYFILFILIAVLSLGNLVTAVIIKIAEEMAAQDEELESKMRREAAMKEINELKEIFIEIDTDGSGKLSKEEYDDALINNARVQMKFEILGISEVEREEVYDLLDTGSGEVGVEQFANGLRDMQGDAKAKDSFTICKKVSHINKNLGNLSVRLKRQQESADELRMEIDEAHRQMGGMLVELRDVMQYLAICMPGDDCKRSKADMEKLDKVLAKRKQQLANIGLPTEAQKTGGGGLRQSQASKQGPKKHVGFAEG